MKKRTFAAQVLAYTFRRSVILTDRASILIGPMVTAYFWLRGGPMPEGLDALIAVGILITAGAALLLRLVSAPYVIWRRDQATITRLKDKLEHPEREQREAMRRYASDLRKTLSAELSTYVGWVQLMSSKSLIGRFVNPKAEEMLQLQTTISNRLWELGYDIPLRLAGWQLMTLCSNIVSTVGKEGFDNALFDRLREQAKLTFRVVHYANVAGGDGAIAELEALLNKHGETLFKGENRESRSLLGIVSETRQ